MMLIFFCVQEQYLWLQVLIILLVCMVIVALHLNCLHAEEVYTSLGNKTNQLPSLSQMFIVVILKLCMLL